MKENKEESEMTPVYEVRTKHTEQVLKDFISFKEAERNAHITFRIVMPGICDVTLAYLGKGSALTYIFGILAVLTFAFALARKPIGVRRLAKADKNYQNQSEIHFIFGESEFRIENPDAGDPQRVKYGEVAFMYTDNKYYYINVNNEDMHMIPKEDFTLGSPEGFYDVIMDKTGKQLKPLKLTWKMKTSILKQAWMEVQSQKNTDKK